MFPQPPRSNDTGSDRPNHATVKIADYGDDKVNVMKSVAKPKQTFCIPYLQATMFACALEDCITQLRILAECNSELHLLNTISNIKTLRAKKYQVEETQVEDPLTTINTKQLRCTQYKLNKLFADRKYCTDVLQKTYLEMALSKSFSALTAYNKEVEDMNVYRDDLINEEGRNRISRRELTRQLRQQRNHMKSIIYDTDSIVDLLMDKVKDTTLNTELRGRYLDKWQLARSEQHQQIILDKEAELSDSLDFYRNRTDNEQRVHAEVELLFNIHINETLAQVEHWMNKYDTDMEAADLKIAIMKNNYQDKVNQRENMEETYVRHEEQVKNWMQFKQKRQADIDYREKMTKCAIVVQAWWRGLLVRLELGPYKPKKKPRIAKKK